MNSTSDINNLLNMPNLNYIMNREKGVWLGANSDGQLHYVKGFGGKASFTIKNIFTFGGEIRRLRSVIDQSFASLSGYMKVGADPVSLEDLAPLASIFDKKYAVCWENVGRISKKILNPKVIDNLKEMTLWPTHTEAKIALEKGIEPKLIAEGKSGVYILHNRKGEPIAVFKPLDEEKGCPNNPKGFTNSDELLTGLESGEGMMRETAAYLLSKNSGVVPHTAIAHFTSPKFHYLNKKKIGEKEGSLQEFIPGKTLFEVWTKDKSSISKLDPNQLMKLIINDIRWNSQDRHAGNMMIDQTGNLWQIDNGDILPGYPGSGSPVERNWQWLNDGFLPLIQQPLSQEEKDIIISFNAEKDVAQLEENGIHLRQECTDFMSISELIMQKAVQRGLNLYHIANLLKFGHSIKEADEVDAWLDEKFINAIQFSFSQLKFGDVTYEQTNHVFPISRKIEFQSQSLSKHYKSASVCKDFVELAQIIVGEEIYLQMTKVSTLEKKELTPDQAKQVYEQFCVLRDSHMVESSEWRAGWEYTKGIDDALKELAGTLKI